MHKRNEKEIKNNREVLKTIIKTIEFCGRQGLALRGGHDFGVLSLNTPIKNVGNFRSLLRYRIESGDNLFLNHIQNCNKNASYMILFLLFLNICSITFVTKYGRKNTL